MTDRSAEYAALNAERLRAYWDHDQCDYLGERLAADGFRIVRFLPYEPPPEGGYPDLGAQIDSSGAQQ